MQALDPEQLSLKCFFGNIIEIMTIPPIFSLSVISETVLFLLQRRPSETAVYKCLTVFQVQQLGTVG